MVKIMITRLHIFKFLMIIFSSLISLHLQSCNKIERVFDKSDDMTDEDFIKITVRFAAFPLAKTIGEMQEEIQNPIKLAQSVIETKKEICHHYGYMLEAWVKKNKEILSDWDKQWIQANVQLLAGNFIGMPGGREVPKNEDEWEMFFIDNEPCLKAPCQPNIR